jgi:hypothetical protein
VTTLRVWRGLRPPVLWAVLPLLVALPSVSEAQTRYVRLQGRVQWISANVLSLSVPDRPGIGIDLVRVPQGDYFGLVQGDWVTVTGQLSDDSRRILGTSIQRSDPSFQAP